MLESKTTQTTQSTTSNRHLVSASDLGVVEIRYLLAVARAFAKPVSQGAPIPLLAGRNVVNLFFENSTRTRMSFEAATRKLGGGILNFAASTSSVQKGETLIDTALNIQALLPQKDPNAPGADALVLRHSSAGSPQFLVKRLRMAVVNAGDGFHEHPTQGLLDAFTIEEKIGDLKGKRVVIIGDIAHSRVARSNIYVLKKLGATVAVCGPPTLLPPKPETLGVDHAFRPEDVLPSADVVMALRIQLERQNRMQLPTLAEYSKFWGINRERAKLLKPSAIILHPGPVNRGVELDPEIADGERSVILDQVSNGVLIRMAVLSWLCNPTGLEQWLTKNGGVHA